MHWTSLRTLWGICEQLEQHFMTFHQNWLLSRPQQWLQQTSEIDSFQDPCVLHWKLTPFKTITVTYMAKCHKLTPFKTLMFCTQFGFLSRPSCFWTQIDSFQDTVQWTIWNITQLTHFKTLIMVYYSVSISMEDYLQNLHGRLPPSRSLQNTLHSEFRTLLWNKRRKTHHMQIINTFQDPRSKRSTPNTTILIKIDSFQDPRNFTSTVDSSICLKTLSSRHWHRTRTLLPLISQTVHTH